MCVCSVGWLIARTLQHVLSLFFLWLKILKNVSKHHSWLIDGVPSVVAILGQKFEMIHSDLGCHPRKQCQGRVLHRKRPAENPLRTPFHRGSLIALMHFLQVRIPPSRHQDILVKQDETGMLNPTLASRQCVCSVEWRVARMLQHVLSLYFILSLTEDTQKCLLAYRWRAIRRCHAWDDTFWFRVPP